MQFRDYLLVVRQRWWIVALATVVAAVTAFTIARTQTPTYRSSVRLEVSGRIEYGQVTAVEKLLRQLAARITTISAAEAVEGKLRSGLGPEALLGKVRAHALTDTMHIQLDVDDADPSRAERVAGAFAEVAQERHSLLMASMAQEDRVALSTLDRPTVARSTSPSAPTATLAGALLGLLAGILVAFALEYLADVMRDVNDVERTLALPVLGVIPPTRKPRRLMGSDRAAKDTSAIDFRDEKDLLHGGVGPAGEKR